jgi:hypothetical protein
MHKQIAQLGNRIRTGWRSFAKFMVHKPIDTPFLPSTKLHRYDRRARFYAYLPQAEEERDWVKKNSANV